MRLQGIIWALVFACVPFAGCVRPRPQSAPPPRCVLEPAPTAYLLKLDDPARIEERILVARVGLIAGTPLRASLLEVRTPAKGFEWRGHLRPVDLVHFAGLRLKHGVAAGEAIRKADLEGDGPESSRAGLLPAGARAVTLRVDWVGGRGAWVSPGDHVDIGLVRQGTTTEPPSVMLLMQDARILMAEPMPIAGGAPPTKPWISVLALPREAAGLALAQRMGLIVLFPRGAQGSRVAVYPPVTLKDLESPAFWQQLQRERLRTIQPRQAPDDPGIRLK